MEHENAKQVAVRDRLHESMIKSYPHMIVEHYNTEYINGTLVVFIVMNFERMPTMDTETVLCVMVGPKGGIKKLDNHNANLVK